MRESWLRELLLPSTDRLVLLELAAVAVVAAALLRLVWRWPHVRLLAIGLVTVTIALFGLRSLH